MSDLATTHARLVALTLFAAVLLSYPLLSIVNTPRLVFGIPILYGYLFGVWLAFIALVALMVETGRR